MTRTRLFLKGLAVPLLILLAGMTNRVQAQYCAPPTTVLHNFINDYMTNVAIAGTTLNSSNGTSTTTGYTLVPPTPANNTATLVQGVSYTLTMTYGGSAGAAYEEAVWIDYDADGILNATTEYIPLVPANGTGASSSVTFTVPFAATAGTTRMRVRTRGGTVTSDACLAYGSGETEDYTITIVAPVPCAGTPLAGTATTSNTSPCPGTSVIISLSGGTIAANLTFGLQSSTTSATAGFGGNIATNATGSFTVTPAAGNTWYRIVTTCNNAGGGSANSVAVQVTGQAPTSTFPWNEGFEGVTTIGANNFPACWKKINGDWQTADAAFIPSTAAYNNDPRTGNRYLLESWSATNEWIMTQGFQLTAGTSYDFSFYWTGDGYSTWQGDVGVNTVQDATGATILTPSFLTNGTMTMAGPYTQVIRTFTPTTSGVYYFGIRINEASGAPWYLGFDDFSLSLTPPCPQPLLSAATALTPTSATINWIQSSGNPANGYEWEVRTSGAPGSGATGLANSGLTAAGVLSANVTGLTASTTYSVYVRANCGGAAGFSPWNGPITFTTLCPPITTLPWNDGFESVTTIGNNFPACWRKINGDWGTYDAGWWFSNDPRTGTRYLTESWGAANEWMMTPGFQLTAGTAYDFSFYWAGDTYTGWTGEVGVNNMQDSTAATILGSPFVTATQATTNTYQQVIRTFTPTTTGTYYFGVRVNATSNPSNLGFDDFRLSVTPTCPQPVMSAATLVASTTATLNWAPATTAPALGYQWEVRTSGQPGSGGATMSGFSPSATVTQPVTGLAGSTIYTAYVRAICSAGDSSFWASTTFTTQLNCNGPTAIAACGTGSYSTAVSGTGAWNLYSATGPFGGPYNTNGIEKIFTFTPTVSGLYTLNVTATNNAYADYFYKPASGGCNSTGWTYIDDVYSPATDTFTMLAGVQYYILVDPEGTGLVQQTFNILCAPSCAAPTNLNAATTTTTASLSWTQPSYSTPSQWQISYGPTGTTAGAGTTLFGTSPVTITGLTPATGYTFFVRAVCGAGDTSAWVGGFGFQTQCVPSTLPFTENFSAGVPPSSCWSRTQGQLTAAPTTLPNLGYSNWFEDGYLNVGFVDAAKVNIYDNGGNQREWLISPSIDLGASPGNFLLEFDFGVVSYAGTTPDMLGSDDTLAVVVSTDNGQTWSLANALQIWTAANTPVNTTTGGQRFFLPMNGYSGVVKIGWYGSNGVVADAADNDIFVDSIQVTATCLPPVVNLGNDTTLCGNISSFVLNAGNSGANTSYVWSSPVAPIIATTQTIDVGPAINIFDANSTSTLVNTVPVIATVTTSPNCSTSDTINITVTLTPRASGITVTGTDPTFSVAPNGELGATSYSWTFGDNSAAVTTQNATHTYANNGIYPVVLVLTNSCGTDTVFTDVTVVNAPNSIANAIDGAAISLYPNPTTADAVLVVSDGLKLRGVQVMSATGQLVMDRQIADGSNRITLRSGTLAPGVYTLRIQLDKGVVVRKLEVLK